MIEVLIHLLLALVILIVVFYIVKLAAGSFGLPPVVVQIAGLILGLVYLLICLRAFGFTGSGVWR